MLVAILVRHIRLALAIAGVALAVLSPACSRHSPATVAPATSVIVISLDTVRQDHLSGYGYSRDTTPALARFASDSVIFDNAFTQFTVTNPSHATMLTGLYPQTHGSRHNGMVLVPTHRTLAEVLSQAGFSTAGFVSGIAMRRDLSGLQRGFSVYDDDIPEGRRDGRIAEQRAVAWLRARQPKERFFLLLHLYDAHGPYLPPPAIAAQFRGSAPPRPLDRLPNYQVLNDAAGAPIRDSNAYVDAYDGTLRYVDELLGDFLSNVDLATTAVVLVADHGESLAERYWPFDHGFGVYDEQSRVPLVIHTPGAGHRRTSELVELVDLMPTILELVDVKPASPLTLPGQSLVPLLRDRPLFRRAARGRDAVFTMATALQGRHDDRGYQLDPQRQVHGIRTTRWKLVAYPGITRDYFELYDLSVDPGELHDVAAQNPQLTGTLLAQLDAWNPDRSRVIPTDSLDPEIEERLRSLGYVGP